MKRWTRDQVMRRRCGQCGREIPVGEVFLLLTFSSNTARKYRCGTCAGPVPPDLPEALEEGPPRPALDLTRIRDLAGGVTRGSAMWGGRVVGEDDEED